MTNTPWEADPIVSQPWEQDPIIGTQQHPRNAVGFIEALSAAWQSSTTGLLVRGRTPELQVDPAQTPFYHRIPAAAVGILGDIPAMAAGALAGAAIPVPGMAKTAFAGAGAFAMPAMFREAYTAWLRGEDVQWSRVGLVGLKEGAIGAATLTTGGIIGRVIPVPQALLARGARQVAIGAGEVSAMTGSRSILEWRVPEAHEFLDAAVLIFGIRLAREVGVPALMRIYERTGVEPKQVAADAARNSDIAQEVLKSEIPEQYRPLEEPRPQIGRALPDETVLERSAYALRHFGDEATMRAEVERIGAQQLRTGSRGVVSDEQLIRDAARDAAWLNETVGQGKATREIGDASAAERIAGYGAVIRSLLDQTRAAAERRDAADPETLPLARAEYAVKEKQLNAVVADFLGAKEEAGRALRAVRVISESIGDIEALYKALNTAGGAKALDLRASLVRELASDAQLATFVRQAGALDKITEYWRASVLSGPATYVVNFLSNSLYLSLRLPKSLTAAAVGEAAGTKGVQYRQVAGEAIGMTLGILQGTRDAARVIRAAFSEDRPAAKAEQHKAAIEGVPGKVVRSLFLPLEAADVFARAINNAATRYSAAARGLSATDFTRVSAWRDALTRQEADVKAGPLAQAVADSLRYTFQEQLPPTMRRWVALAHVTPGLKWVFPFLFPFVRTATNVYIEALRLMPGVGLLVGRAKEEWMRGGEARDRVIADQIVGSSIALATAVLVDAGIISGGGPVDRAGYRALYERKWRPYSIKIEDTWVSYQRLEPLATLVGTIADLWYARRYMSEGEYDKLAGALALTLRNQVREKTFMQGAVNLIDLATPEEYGGQRAANVLADMLGGFVPGLVVQIDRETDTAIRDVRGFVDRIISRIPIIRRQMLIPQRDLFGEVVTQDTLFPFSGIRISRESNDPVRVELARLGYAPQQIREATVDVAPGLIKAPIELEKQQLDSLRTEAGKMAHAALSQIIKTTTWKQIPDTELGRAQQRAIIEQVFAQARQRARFGVIGSEAIRKAVTEALQR